MLTESVAVSLRRFKRDSKHSHTFLKASFPLWIQIASHTEVALIKLNFNFVNKP